MRDKQIPKSVEKQDLGLFGCAVLATVCDKGMERTTRSNT